ncbi:MAG: DUF302 domain-containing protein [Pseudomonadota bacterium]
MRLIAAFFALLMSAGVAFAQTSAPDGWVIKTSPHSVDDTVEKLTTAIEKAGATVFAVVDHSGGAANVGLELAPTKLVIFGNPKIGTPIMQGNIHAGIDLPVRILVFEDQRETRIGYLKPSALKARYQIAGADASLDRMTGALDKLTDAARK